MSKIKIKRKNEMKECFEKIRGIYGISERAIEICKHVGDNRMRAIFAIGRMARLFESCKKKPYWKEKTEIGKIREYYSIKQASKNKGLFLIPIDDND